MSSVLNIRNIYTLSLCILVLSACISCTKEYLVPFPIPGPKVPHETDELQASFVSEPVDNIHAGYWKGADYKRLEIGDLSSGNLYEDDGLLNHTGTYNGLRSYNGGVLPEMRLRAAYDSIYLYMLIEWSDTTVNARRSSWLWDGREDPLKEDSASAWTSQYNDDQLAIVFEIESASGPAGNFSSVGCAAMCHEGAFGIHAGSMDIWNWSMALSEPFGFAFDMHANPNESLKYDNGQISYQRNIREPGNNRSGPEYEWSGTAQESSSMEGSYALLDPAFFLLEKTEFTGDPEIGDMIYHHKEKGCYHCHGENGEGNGEIDNGPAFTNPRMNRFSRENLINSASSLEHTGYTYFNKVRSDELDDLIARLRGFAGIPGYYLEKPDSGNVDLITRSNMNIARLDEETESYKLLIKRKLQNGDSDDVQFEPGSGEPYIFGIAIMDADGKNHIGSLMEKLIFLANEN